MAWQIYWVNGRFTASDARAKLLVALAKLTGRADDGAAIVVHADDHKGQAQARLEAFLTDHLAAIESQLLRARGGE